VLNYVIYDSKYIQEGLSMPKGRPISTKTGEPLEKIAVLLERETIEWMDETIKRLKPKKRGISRGMLVRLALKRLQNEKWDDRDMLMAISLLL